MVNSVHEQVIKQEPHLGTHRKLKSAQKRIKSSIDGISKYTAYLKRYSIQYAMYFVKRNVEKESTYYIESLLTTHNVLIIKLHLPSLNKENYNV